VDDDSRVILNALHEPLSFRLPEHLPSPWEPVLDTGHPPVWGDGLPHASGETQVVPRSLVVLIHPR